MVVKQYYRPPGALPEVGFMAACTRCGDCITACPVHAIMKVPADGGFAAGTPYLDPGFQPCVVCPDMPCARACPTEALTVPEHGWQGLRLGKLELLTGALHHLPRQRLRCLCPGLSGGRGGAGDGRAGASGDPGGGLRRLRRLRPRLHHGAVVAQTLTGER